MRYLCLIILSLFLIGCDKPYNPNCIDGYRVMSLDRKLTAFCKSAGSDSDTVYGYACIEVTGMASHKRVDEIRLSEGGMYFEVKCYNPNAVEDITPAMSYIQGLNFVQEN